jgi:hypothetical protein
MHTLEVDDPQFRAEIKNSSTHAEEVVDGSLSDYVYHKHLQTNAIGLLQLQEWESLTVNESQQLLLDHAAKHNRQLLKYPDDYIQSPAGTTRSIQQLTDDAKLLL